MTVQGVNAIKAALAVHKAKSITGLREGLYQAGLFLQRESMKIVPVDTTLLRTTATTRMVGGGDDPEVIVGYGTDYAVYVHEIQAQHKPGKSWKFLEIPLREKRDHLKKVIERYIKKGGGSGTVTIGGAAE